jgi:acetoin utilization protein AcuB
MNCGNLIDLSFPALQWTDTVGKAKDLIRADGCLVVLQDHQFKGLLYAEDLEDVADTLTLASCLNYYTLTFVSESDFFLTALRKMREQQVPFLPVVSLSGEYLGVLTQEALIDTLSQYLSAGDPGGVIILQMVPHQFSISEIGRIVESNNAKILHLTTWTDTATGMLMVSMKVNKIDIQDILASFERYQFTVSQYFGENLSEETLKSNFDNLMNYLRM